MVSDSMSTLLAKFPLDQRREMEAMIGERGADFVERYFEQLRL